MPWESDEIPVNVLNTCLLIQCNFPLLRELNLSNQVPLSFSLVHRKGGSYSLVFFSFFQNFLLKHQTPTLSCLVIQNTYFYNLFRVKRSRNPQFVFPHNMKWPITGSQMTNNRISRWKSMSFSIMLIVISELLCLNSVSKSYLGHYIYLLCFYTFYASLATLG